MYIYSVQRGCENLQTGSKMADFTCNNQETDTVIFFISHTLRKHGFLPGRKKARFKNVRKNIDEAKELLENFGKSLAMTEDCFKSVILFVIRFTYNDRKSSSLAVSRCLS